MGFGVPVIIRLSLLLGCWGHASHIDWTWSDFLDLRNELADKRGKFRPFAGAQVEHPDSAGADIDLLQYVVDTLHSRPCPEITVDKMTVPFKTPHDHNAVSAVLKGLEQE